jgi:hypothetical protein
MKTLLQKIFFKFLEYLYDKWQDRKDSMSFIQDIDAIQYDSATIKRSTKYYVKPKCSNLDPGQETETRRALIATREDLFNKIDEFIGEDSSKRHLLLLAESGIGKTSFALNYFAYNKKKRKSKRSKLLLVYLGATNAEELISRIEEKRESVIILDAFDEDTSAIADHRERIAELMKLCQDFSRVIVTCRTQFFSKDEEIPIETGVLKIGARSAGDTGKFEFWKLYLSPFDDKQIQKYLNKRYNLLNLKNRRAAKSIVAKMPLLSVRPMLLAYIPDVLESGQIVNNSYELYEIMVNAWIKREARWVNPDDLYSFSEKLSVNLFFNRTKRKAEHIPFAELPQLAKEFNIKLESWQIQGRSLLNKDAEGNYKFSHRSIMEFLFVQSLLNGNKDCQRVMLTDQMKIFLMEKCKIRESLDRGIFLSENVAVEIVDDMFPQDYELNNSNSNAMHPDIQKIRDFRGHLMKHLSAFSRVASISQQIYFKQINNRFIADKVITSGGVIFDTSLDIPMLLQKMYDTLSIIELSPWIVFNKLIKNFDLLIAICAEIISFLEGSRDIVKTFTVAQKDFDSIPENNEVAHINYQLSSEVQEVSQQMLSLRLLLEKFEAFFYSPIKLLSSDPYNRIWLYRDVESNSYTLFIAKSYIN